MTTTIDNNSVPMAEEAQPQIPNFSLPPYPQMIMEALEACTDGTGCNKSAIAKYIESTQITIPPSHTTLLNYHLNQMKNSGQIALVKNNYMKPDQVPPPSKRGRGRPPKPKPEVDPSSNVAVSAPSLSPPRPRGRPPKAKDSLSEPSAIEAKPKAPSVSGRPRGRPPKKAKIESETVTAEAPPAAQPEGERRGRGRPPKVKPAAMVPVGC